MTMPETTMMKMINSLAAVKKFWTKLASRTLAQFTRVISTERAPEHTPGYSL